ncbi:MAG: hypothetical protein EA424_07105 [Planctomycetaceae bacterium]|nr:MAG: hypothetical protein EA424_07105 [Planctomycetaceae bacterium]
MGEDLLGYLLNVVDEQERRRIEAALVRDSQLRRQFETLRQQFSSHDTSSVAEPPPGLAEQTCDLVHGYQQLQRQRAVEARESCNSGSRRFWSIVDAMTFTGLILVAATLFLPAIANSWFRSDILGCQRNLQRLGIALYEFSDFNERLFPKIPVSGNRAAAGIYGPILYHAGYLDDPQVIVCPSSSLAADATDWRIPTFRELDEATGLELERLRRRMGGSYGYVLGYVLNRRHFPPKNAGRSFYALMSDAPSMHLPGRHSSNHLGRGHNVLYEDGRVEFISRRAEPRLYKPLFVNRLGFAEAGADENDYVIGGSWMPPVRRAMLVR